MMTVSVKSNIDAVLRRMTDIQRKQIPFAASVAINETLKELRDEQMRGMQRDLDRPTPFTVKGVQYKRSTKANLTGTLFIEGKRAAYLKYQVSGGTRLPRRKVLIIGLTARNQYGNTPAFRAFVTRLLAKQDHFEQTINGTSGIWKRTKGGRLQLVAQYIRQATYHKRFNFYGRAKRVTQERFPVHFSRALTRALATAR